MNSIGMPALVTTSPQGTSQTNAGILEASKTQSLLGGKLNEKLRSGIMLNLGLWSDQFHHRAIEFNYLKLGNLASSFQQGSDGAPILARPYGDAITGAPSSELVAFPGVVGGSILATVESP